MGRKALFAAVVLLAFWSWLLASGRLALAQDDPEPGSRAAEAERIVTTYPLVDTHIDAPYQMNKEWRDLSMATPDREFDYPRARQGGLDVVFMSIYLPASTEADGTAYNLANQLIDQVEATAFRDPDKFAMVYSVAEARRSFNDAKNDAKIGFALGMENGAPIAGSIENLEHFHRRGIRYITLTHSKANHISDSSYDEVRYWDGLSPFGLEVVRHMNRLGMMVDVSHLSDEAFYDVLEVTRAPVVATHSSARHFTPGFERNMDNDMIRALGRNGGVIMINFGSGFITEEANRYREGYGPAIDAYRERHGLEDDSPELDAFREAYRAQHPYPFAGVEDVADHIDHVRRLAGIEHVGLGSDYDGVGDTLPIGLKDVSTYPNLVAELLRRRYSEADIALLLGGNILRVWEEVEKAAETE